VALVANQLLERGAFSAKLKSLISIGALDARASAAPQRLGRHAAWSSTLASPVKFDRH
jgi:hypothetical protein